MTAYILTFYFFFILAFIEELKIILFDKKKIFYFKFLIFVFLIIYIGLRDNVGGDWGNYYQNYFISKVNENYDLISYLQNYLLTKDPLFHLLNYLVIKIYPSYHLVNFLCAIIFSTFLIYFCFNLKRPFLALLISCPYLITVVAMGYHRQALALSFFMAGIIQLEKNNTSRYFLLIFIAFLFHFTSIFLLIFGILANSKLNLKIIFISISICIIFIILIEPIFIKKIIDVYIINPQLSSKGAFLRISLCLISSLIFFKFQSNYLFDLKNVSLIKLQSYITFVFVLTLIIFPKLSTLLDRLAIYFIPFQMIIFSNFLSIFSKNDFSRIIIFFAISLAYFCVLLIWIYFGSFSYWWFPYLNFLFI